MSFEDLVEDLSRKYCVNHGRLYDLMLYKKYSLLLSKPNTYVFNMNQCNTDAYNIIYRYLRFREYKRQSTMEALND